MSALLGNLFVIQLIGFIALVVSLLVFQVNRRGNMLKLQMSAAIMYSLHFFLLGAFTGAAMNILGALRNFLFYKTRKRTRLLPGLLIFAFSFAGIITWQGPLSLLPILGMISGTLAFWQSNPKHIRRLALMAPPLWFIYDLMSGSYPGMLTELIMFSSNCVGIYRFDIQKTSPKINREIELNKILN
jgi:hypothetical protein